MRIFILLLSIALVAGCAKQQPGKDGATSPAGTRSTFGPARLTRDQVRAEVMSMADTYVTSMAQALDEVRSNTKRPEVVDWTLQTKIATATAAFTNVVGPNELVCLADMVVLVTLKRAALEEHWIPTFLHDEGKPLLASYQRAEADMLAMAARSFTPRQIEELRKLIEQWRREYPGQYYVSHVRLAELAPFRALRPDSAQIKVPGSLFSLLYIDPLANLDPVAQELRAFRLLTERMVFMFERMPMIFGWQGEYVMMRGTSTPQIVRFVEGTERFAGATERFADTVKKYPEDFSRTTSASIEQIAKNLTAEREAAIQQVADQLDAQREAIGKDLEAQEERVRQLLADASQLVQSVSEAGASINSATAQTVTTTEEATRRTLDHAFKLSLILILTLLAGIPFSVAAYQFLRRRNAKRE